MKDSMQDLLKQFVMFLLAVIVSMTGFWLMIGRDFVTRAEVEEKINENINPKVALIDQKLDGKIKNDEKMMAILENFNRTINDLNVQVGVLSKTLEYLEKRLDDDSRFARSK